TPGRAQSVPDVAANSGEPRSLTGVTPIGLNHPRSASPAPLPASRPHDREALVYMRAVLGSLEGHQAVGARVADLCAGLKRTLGRDTTTTRRRAKYHLCAARRGVTSTTRCFVTG